MYTVAHRRLPYRDGVSERERPFQGRTKRVLCLRFCSTRSKYPRTLVPSLRNTARKSQSLAPTLPLSASLPSDGREQSVLSRAWDCLCYCIFLHFLHFLCILFYSFACVFWLWLLLSFIPHPRLNGPTLTHINSSCGLAPVLLSSRPSLCLSSSALLCTCTSSSQR